MPDPEIKPNDAAPKVTGKDVTQNTGQEGSQDIDAKVTPSAAATPRDLEDVPVKKVGFVPVVLGGIVAAGLGYGAAFMGYGMDHSPLTQRLAALEGELAARPDATAGLEALRQDVAAQAGQAQSMLDAQVAAATAPLQDELAALAARLDTLASEAAAQSAPDAGGPDTSVLEQELATLRDALAAQGAQLQEFAQSRTAEAAAASETAVAAADAAAAEARAQMMTALQARLQTALDGGADFTDALEDLRAQGGDLPAALADIPAGGVAALAQLQDDFTPAARAALVADRATDNGLMGFLQNRFNPRSVAPREGDDADAVLSRAGAAVMAGDLATAVREVGALTGAAQAEMAPWLARAEARLSAEAAIVALGTAQ